MLQNSCFPSRIIDLNPKLVPGTGLLYVELVEKIRSQNLFESGKFPYPSKTFNCTKLKLLVLLKTTMTALVLSLNCTNIFNTVY